MKPDTGLRTVYPDILSHPGAIEDLWIAVIKEAIFDLHNPSLTNYGPAEKRIRIEQAKFFLFDDSASRFTFICFHLGLDKSKIRQLAASCAADMSIGKLGKITARHYDRYDNQPISLELLEDAFKHILDDA